MVNHVFDPNFCLDELKTDGPVAVIGAGISGGNIALRMAEKMNAGLLLVSRKEVLVSDFDFAPGWIGPMYLEGFHRQTLDQRRQQIVAARAKGSVPGDLKIALDKAAAMKSGASITTISPTPRTTTEAPC